MNAAQLQRVVTALDITRMQRTLALVVALVALVIAGVLWTRDRPVAVATELAMPAAAPQSDDDTEPLTAPVSPVTPAMREARRFARLDKDHNNAVSRTEYLASRQQAFVRLDSNGDGRLAFGEYASAAVKKFGKTDRDANGGLDADEFATTAPKKREKPVCDCAK